MRILACMSVCSVYQSHGHPVWFMVKIYLKYSSEHTAGWQFHTLLLKIWSYIYIDNVLSSYMVRRGKIIMYRRSKKGNLTVSVRN
jgi:hypothetical protein